MVAEHIAILGPHPIPKADRIGQQSERATQNGQAVLARNMIKRAFGLRL
jgi:hypothetical protein